MAIDYYSYYTLATGHWERVRGPPLFKMCACVCVCVCGGGGGGGGTYLSTPGTCMCVPVYIYIFNSYTTAARDFADIYTQSPRAAGVYVNKIPSSCGISDIYISLGVHSPNR